MKKVLSIILSAAMIVTVFASMAVTADASTASKVKKKLVSTNWQCYECDGDSGVQGPNWYYGHQRPQIFKIKFKKNKKFVCNMGAFVEYTGTYKVKQSGKATLRIKTKTKGDGKIYKVNKTVKLNISKNKKRISFKFDGVKNKFKKKWW